MQKTENYQLCHWVASDRVLMEDFNSDNTKLEAALTGLAAADAAEQNARAAQDTALAQQISQLAVSVPIVKLLDQAVTSEQTRLDIDMSQIDLTQYAEILILPMLSAATNTVYLTCNQIPTMDEMNTSPYRLCAISTSGYFGRNKSTIRLQTYGEALHCAYEYMDEDAYEPLQHSRVFVQPEEIKTLYFISSSGEINPGSRIVMWGLRL